MHFETISLQRRFNYGFKKEIVMSDNLKLQFMEKPRLEGIESIFEVTQVIIVTTGIQGSCLTEQFLIATIIYHFPS
jgi:hypothetical protein